MAWNTSGRFLWYGLNHGTDHSLFMRIVRFDWEAGAIGYPFRSVRASSSACMRACLLLGHYLFLEWLWG